LLYNKTVFVKSILYIIRR